MEYEDLARIKGLKTMKKIKFIVISIFGLFSLCFAAEESITITTYYPSPHGSYSSLQTDKFGVGDNNGDGLFTSADVPTTTGNVWIKGNVGIGTTSPHSPAPNGQPGNLDVNDVYLKSKGIWMSNTFAVSDEYSCHKPGGTGNIDCSIGVHKACFMTGVKTTEDDKDNYDGCHVVGTSGGDWQIQLRCHSNDTYDCWARCLD